MVGQPRGQAAAIAVNKYGNGRCGVQCADCGRLLVCGLANVAIATGPVSGRRGAHLSRAEHPICAASGTAGDRAATARHPSSPLAVSASRAAATACSTIGDVAGIEPTGVAAVAALF